MARADLLLALVRAALTGDVARSRAVVEAIAAEEGRKRHTVLARELGDALAASNNDTSVRRRQSTVGGTDALAEILPGKSLESLSLPDRVLNDLLQLVEEQSRTDLLRSYNLEPRHRILLIGPPGNGKTSCAEAIASELSIPLLVLRYERVITSFLGETAARLEDAFDEVRRRRCVLFLDEFDVLGKERSDEHEIGEIKRVVSGLLLQLDKLPSHVVVVAATNHAEILDHAAWRRFQLHAELNAPNHVQASMYIRKLARRMDMDLSEVSAEAIAKALGGSSYAQLEDFALDLRRRQVLSGAFSATQTRSLVKSTIASRLPKPQDGSTSARGVVAA